MTTRIADPNDPRALVLRRFRNYAIFWIILMVAYFVGTDLFLETTNMPVANATPALLLMLGCIVIAAIWHAAAIITMSASGLLEKK